jgi:hypothetical protein
MFPPFFRVKCDEITFNVVHRSMVLEQLYNFGFESEMIGLHSRPQIHVKVAPGVGTFDDTREFIGDLKPKLRSDRVGLKRLLIEAFKSYRMFTI